MKLSETRWISKLINTFDPTDNCWYKNQVEPVMRKRTEELNLTASYKNQVKCCIRREVFAKHGSECTTPEIKLFLDGYTRETLVPFLNDKDKKLIYNIQCIMNSPNSLIRFHKRIIKKVRQSKDKSRVEEEFAKLKVVRSAFLF